MTVAPGALVSRTPHAPMSSVFDASRSQSHYIRAEQMDLHAVAVGFEQQASVSRDGGSLEVKGLARCRHGWKETRRRTDGRSNSPAGTSRQAGRKSGRQAGWQTGRQKVRYGNECV